MIEYWPDIDRSNYNQLKEKYETQIWEFKQEAIYYFYLDCKSLFTILEDFNKIVFKLFNVNIHKPLTISSLAIRIFFFPSTSKQAGFLEPNTIHHILDKVEEDIRQAVTGDYVDLFIPHNLHYI